MQNKTTTKKVTGEHCFELKSSLFLQLKILKTVDTIPLSRAESIELNSNLPVSLAQAQIKPSLQNYRKTAFSLVKD